MGKHLQPGEREASGRPGEAMDRAGSPHPREWAHRVIVILILLRAGYGRTTSRTACSTSAWKCGSPRNSAENNNFPAHFVEQFGTVLTQFLGADLPPLLLQVFDGSFRADQAGARRHLQDRPCRRGPRIFTQRAEEHRDVLVVRGVLCLGRHDRLRIRPAMLETSCVSNQNEPVTTLRLLGDVFAGQASGPQTTCGSSTFVSHHCQAPCLIRSRRRPRHAHDLFDLSLL